MHKGSPERAEFTRDVVVQPCASEVVGGQEIVSRVPISEAEFFGVYTVHPDGTLDWHSDYTTLRQAYAVASRLSEI